MRENLRVSGQIRSQCRAIERQGGWIRQERSVWLIWSNAVAWLYGPGPAKSFLLVVIPTEKPTATSSPGAGVWSIINPG